VKLVRNAVARRFQLKVSTCNSGFRVSILRSFLVGHVVQNRQTALSLAGTNGFHAKAKNGKFTAPYTFKAHIIVRTSKPKISRRRFADSAPKSARHVQLDYFSSFNQLNH